MAAKQYVIVVGTDYSPHGYRAVRAAAREAAKHPHSRLHVVHVVPSLGPLHELPPLAFARFAGPKQQTEQDAGLTRLDEHVAAALDNLQLPGELQIETRVIAGDPEAVLLDLAWDLRANVMVVGTRGRRYSSRWALGSVAETVVRQAPCAVLVIGPRVQLSPEHLAKSAPS
jgi:nucleotide-binding universal stress UspA family protein